MNMIGKSAAAFAFASAFLFAQAAWAHAHVKTSEPAADATVAAPAAVVIHFSEDLALKSSKVEVSSASGKVAIKDLAQPDPRTLAATPSAPLTAGVYTVSWIAVSDVNGHKTDGTYKFTVK